MEEAEDDALGNERREIVLVVASARDDDREVRELLVHLGDEGLGVVVGERGVDEEHRIARGDHEIRRVRRVVGSPDTVMAGNRVTQEVDESRVGRQDDDVRAARARARLLKCGMRAGCAGRRRRRSHGLDRDDGLGCGHGLRRGRIQRIRGVVTRLDV